MKHTELGEKLLGLYDGPVNEKERAWVETHLASCEDCAQVLEEYKAVSAQLFAVPTFSESEEDMFTAKVMARVRAKAMENQMTFGQIALRWLLPLAGSTAMAAWVFFSVLPSTPEFANDNNEPSYFTSQTALSVNALAPTSSKPSSEEIVVSWMRQ